MIDGMATGIERRATLAEYGQLFVAAFVVVVCAAWVVWMATLAMHRFENYGVELSFPATAVISLRWIGLLLLPGLLLCVWQLKRTRSSRVVTILAAYAHAFAAALWLVVAVIALWAPMSGTLQG
jgi:hypothetical protein